MHYSVKNLIYIENNIKNSFNKLPIIIAVSKTFSQENLIPLLEFGHKNFGENKVQECVQKWRDLKQNYKDIKLHMIGKLQTNKVKDCLKYFDYIHSVDSKKLAKKIFDEQEKIHKKVKIFIQVNIGGEEQKSGVDINQLEELIIYCKELKLNLIGLMCIPPKNFNVKFYFDEMNILKSKYSFNELSMGMSSDYLEAIKFGSSFVRIGSKIFGTRVKKFLL